MHENIFYSEVTYFQSKKHKDKQVSKSLNVPSATFLAGVLGSCEHSLLT